MKHILKFTLLVFLLSSCGAAVKTYKKRTPTNNFAEVKVFNIQQDVPRDAEVLGKLKIGYNLYFRECNYDSVISKLKKEARKIGGNTLKIIAHKPYHTPLSKESCHKIKVKVLFIDKDHLENVKTPAPHPNYAMIYLYRYYGQSSFKYNVFVNDTIKVRMKVATKDSIKVVKQGQYNIHTEDKEAEIRFNVELGKSYFVQCGEEYNHLLAKPTIALKGKEIGQKEYDSFVEKN